MYEQWQWLLRGFYGAFTHSYMRNAVYLRALVICIRVITSYFVGVFRVFKRSYKTLCLLLRNDCDRVTNFYKS